jgi:hypothetical protein
MVPQVDILHCANMLLKNYGLDDAVYRAASRAEAFNNQGDLDRQLVWKQITKAIKEMASTERQLSDPTR